MKITNFPHDAFNGHMANIESGESANREDLISGGPEDRLPGILVIEHNTVIGLDIALTVQDLGFGLVGVATSVPKAFRLLETSGKSPDCALLDVRLGNDDAVPLLQEFNKRNIRCVVVTAIPEEEVRTMGFQGLIVAKPFCSHTLREAILTAVNCDSLQRCMM